MSTKVNKMLAMLPAYLGYDEPEAERKGKSKSAPKRPTNADFAHSWDRTRRSLLWMLKRKDKIDDADRLLKNWERWLRCEQLARALAAEEGEPKTIDVRIEGM